MPKQGFRRSTTTTTMAPPERCAHDVQGQRKVMFIDGKRLSLCADCQAEQAYIRRTTRTTRDSWSFQADQEAMQIARGTRICDPFEPKRVLT